MMLYRHEPVLEMVRESSDATSIAPSTRPEFFDPPRLPSSDTDALRKRHSIFGRSKPTLTGMQSARTHNSTRSQSGIVEVGESPASRPASSAGRSHQSHTEPGALHRWRKSFFDKTRRARATWNHDGEPETSLQRPSSAFSSGSRPMSHASVLSEEEYYRNMKKGSISPPFNFTHVVHTGRQQLPRLDTIDEKQLVKEFWAASAYQQPRRHLNGIVADDLTVKHREMGYEPVTLAPRPATSQSMRASYNWFQGPSRAHHEADCLPESQSTDGMADRAVVRSPSFLTRPEQERYPRRQSSLGALDDFKNSGRSPDIPRDSSLRTYSTASVRNASRPNEVSGSTQAPQDLEVVSEENEAFVRLQPWEMQERAKQPLPPLPPHALSKQISTSSLGSGTCTSTSQCSSVSASNPVGETRPTTLSMRESQIASIASDNRRASIASNPSWEDDVDFCYEQAAESTCNFDWDHPPTQEGRNSTSPSIESDGGVRLSKWFPPFPLAEPINRSSLSLKLASSDDSLDKTYSHSTHHQRTLHTRPSIVGHKGFAAARKDSHEQLKQNTLPSSNPETTPTIAAISKNPNPPFLPPLSPIPSEPAHTPFSPNTLHFPTFFDGSPSDCLSDPESIRTNGSRHRKSSSYGSWESFGRPFHNSSSMGYTSWSATRYSTHAATTTRKSMFASLGSTSAGNGDNAIAAGGHKRSQSDNTPFVFDTNNLNSRPTISHPLSLALQSSTKFENVDTAVMQAAGRAVQRGRPGTPSYGRVSRVGTGTGGAVAVLEVEEVLGEGTGGWI